MCTAAELVVSPESSILLLEVHLRLGHDTHLLVGCEWYTCHAGWRGLVTSWSPDIGLIMKKQRLEYFCLEVVSKRCYAALKSVSVLLTPQWACLGLQTLSIFV